MDTFPAFKEWAVVCEALGAGKQSILLRKGGIAEGREGFRFQHEEFFLFPTWFHEQLEKTVLPPEAFLPQQEEEVVEIRYAAQVEWTCLVTDYKKLHQLREFHILQDSVVEERFHYDEPLGVHVAFVRVYRLDPPQRIPNKTQYGGCRSWVHLPQCIDSARVSVISEEEHEKLRTLLQQILEL